MWKAKLGRTCGKQSQRDRGAVFGLKQMEDSVDHVRVVHLLGPLFFLRDGGNGIAAVERRGNNVDVLRTLT